MCDIVGAHLSAELQGLNSTAVWPCTLDVACSGFSSHGRLCILRFALLMCHSTMRAELKHRLAETPGGEVTCCCFPSSRNTAYMEMGALVRSQQLSWAGAAAAVASQQANCSQQQHLTKQTCGPLQQQPAAPEAKCAQVEVCMGSSFC
jgi:hypothetical protein